MNQQVDSLWLS